MNKVVQWVKDVVANEPVLTSYLINGGAAAVFAYLLHWSATKEAALATVVTGLAGLYTLIRTTPPHVSGFAGIISTMVVASASFGLHISPKGTALLVLAITALVPMLVRVHVSPVASAAKQ
jgi:hypothetical protein